MIELDKLKTEIEDFLANLQLPDQPANLYEPISYLLQLNGKRIRPAAVLLANTCFGGDGKSAMPAAIAVEVFHNFTLMHDDIMDKAPLRRGMATVHEKWNTTIAILSGDAMMVKAYQLIEQVDAAHLYPVFKVFNQTALEVCEGQQLDMDFETSNTVTINNYIEMIRLKTAVLLAASLRIGAIIADASVTNQELISMFGENLGIAFQLQDDLLDCFADGDKFGKQVGGDILDNKKTFLLLTAQNLANDNQKQLINGLLAGNSASKVADMLAIYKELAVDELTRNEVKKYTEKAIAALNGISLPKENLKPLFDLADLLLLREV